MKLFVTGASGFLGSAFLNQAVAAGHECIGLSRSPTPSMQRDSSIHWIRASLAQISSTDLVSCDALVHFASVGVSPQPTTWDEAFNVNVAQSIAIINSAIQAGVGKILLCGSCFEYGTSGERYQFIPANAPLEPIGPYAASKAACSLAATALAREVPSTLVLLRPFHIFGEGQHPSNFWPSLKEAAMQGRDFSMTAGQQLRDFLSVEETASKFLDCLNQWPGSAGKIHVANLGSGLPVSLRDFASSWWERWNAHGYLRFGDIPYRPNEVMRFVPALTAL